MTRFKTYLLKQDESGEVWGTFDSNTEPMPTEYVAGPFNVNITEAEKIQDGAQITLSGSDVVVEVAD